jgi:hypothetical protein
MCTPKYAELSCQVITCNFGKRECVLFSFNILVWVHTHTLATDNINIESTVLLFSLISIK